MSVSAACLPTRDGSVRVEGDLDAAVALITVTGAWDRTLGQQVRTAVDECLADHPEAVILDLSALRDSHTVSAATWVSAQHRAARMDPPVQLALCIPAELPLADKMQHLGTRRFLPVYARVRQARAAITSRLPSAERVKLTLPPEPESPSLARNLAGDACLAWGLPDLLYPSRLLMSELVTNAVEHAGTEITVAVTGRAAGLHLIVSDGVATPPRLIKPARPRRDQPLDERGNGLQVVNATATAWGWLPTRTGKVVWATLRPPRPAAHAGRSASGAATAPR